MVLLPCCCCNYKCKLTNNQRLPSLFLLQLPCSCRSTVTGSLSCSWCNCLGAMKFTIKVSLQFCCNCLGVIIKQPEAPYHAARPLLKFSLFNFFVKPISPALQRALSACLTYAAGPSFRSSASLIKLFGYLKLPTKKWGWYNRLL